MSNVVKRLLTFFIGAPLIFALVLVKPGYHFPLQIVILLVSFISLNEYHKMASTKVKLFPKWIFVCLGLLIPACSYLFFFIGLSQEILLWLYTIIVIIFMAIECFSANEFSTSLEKIAISSLGIFYVGYMITFVQRLCSFENNSMVIILFLAFVFLCDSAAWFFGILFGKNNRGFIKASPNKSIAGFVGGILSDIALAVLLKFLLAKYLPADIWRYMILAFGTACAAIVGDLIESVIKRSCNTKDSGRVIPGRGGMIDCIDSIVVAAPVFYIIYYFLIFA
ncbi:MAG: phosphatidate cytidylyltransferase [Treponema sp.]|nr:phosphatidate cytidylyltransferase [Treponema sp.]